MKNKDIYNLKTIIERIKLALSKSDSYSNEERLKELNEDLWFYNTDELLLWIMDEMSFKSCIPNDLFENFDDSDLSFEMEKSWYDNMDDFMNNNSNYDFLKYKDEYKNDKSKVIDYLLTIDFNSYFLIK